MKKTIVLLFTIALCFQFKYAYPQKVADYIATDSSISTGIKLIPSSPKLNSQYIKVKVKDGEVMYTPDQITRYGLRDGTVYEAEKIQVDGEERKLFLERLVEGKITLYRYVGQKYKTYFIRKDSSDLQEVHRDMESLKLLSQDCEFVADAIRVASYNNKESIRRLVSQYNKCQRKPFPYKKVGILTGVKRISLIQPSNSSNTLVNDVSFPTSSLPIIGLYGDFPLFMSEFSFHPELFFTRYNVTAKGRSSQTDVDVLVSLSSLHVPVLIRYTVPTPVWRLFFNAGPYFSYNLENSSDIYYATLSNNTVTIERPVQKKLGSDYMVGYSGGLGLQRNLNFRKTISAEVRYTRAIGPDDTTLTQKGLDLIVGFTF